MNFVSVYKFDVYRLTVGINDRGSKGRGTKYKNIHHFNNNMMYKTVYTMLVSTGGEVLPFTVSMRYKLDILPIDGFQLSIKHPTSRDKCSIKRLLYSRPFSL